MDNQEIKYSSKEFIERTQNNTKYLRHNKHLFDFVIHVGDVKYPVHKLVLARSSEYFRAMLTNDTLESRKNEVQMENISVIAMDEIINFMYTAEVKLNIENVQEILTGANILQIEEIQNFCVNYIEERIDTSNCLGVLRVADHCDLEKLYQSALNFCLNRFKDIIMEKEFLELDVVWLSRIISHDQLNINEEAVFNAILKWIEFEPQERLKFSDELISNVRFALIDPIRLISLSNLDLIKDSSTCRNLVEEAKDYILLKDHPELRSHMNGPRFEPRKSLQRQQRIYAVGGWTNEYKPIASIEKYDPYLDDWFEGNPMTRPRCGVGVVILGDSLYAIGGHDGAGYLRSTERYDIIKEAWYEDVADMKSEKTSVGVVSLHGYIYAIGGQIGIDSLANVERYNPKTNIWEDCAPLQEKRLGAGVTVLNGLIYVMGGANDNKVLRTVERYDPRKNEWTFVEPMTNGRKHLGCTNYYGKIYAIGGRGDDSELNTAECYDPESDNWVPITPMSEKRAGIGLVELDGLLYAVGGHNGDARLKLVEAYDPVTGTWSQKKSMIYDRLGGGLAVYSKIKSTSP